MTIRSKLYARFKLLYREFEEANARGEFDAEKCWEAHKLGRLLEDIVDNNLSDAEILIRKLET